MFLLLNQNPKNLNISLEQSKFIPAAVIFLILFFCYANSFQNGFVIDDHQYLVYPGNISEVSFSELFTKSYDRFYRPVGLLALKLVLAIFGKNPLAFHVCNFILFYLICWFVFIILNHLFTDKIFALFTACLYAAHPFHTVLLNHNYSVCINVSIVLILTSIWSFIKYLDSKNFRLYVTSIGLFMLAILSHLLSSLTPIYLFLIMIFLKNYSIKKSLYFLLPYFVLTLGLIVFRTAFLDVRGLDTIFELNISFWSYIATLTDLLVWYHLKLLFPIDTIFIWDTLIVERYAILKSLSFFVLIVLSIYLILFKWRKNEKGFFLSFFLVGFAPIFTASFMYTNITSSAMIEPHWFMISSIGFFALAARFFLKIRKKIQFRIWTTMIVAIMITLCTLTFRHNRLWKSDKIYGYYWFIVNPLNGVSLLLYTNSYLSENNIREPFLGLISLDKYLIKKQNYLAYFNRGQAYMRLNKLHYALKDFSQTIELNPLFSLAYNNRSIAFLNLGQYRQALNDINQFLELNPFDTIANHNRDIILKEMIKHEVLPEE